MTTHEFLTWTEVNQTHNTIRAIYHMGKLVHSMLITDNGKNIVTDTNIIFMLPKSIQYANDLTVTSESLEKQNKFKLFRKIDKNKWIFLGRGIIEKINHDPISDYEIHIKVIKKSSLKNDEVKTT